MRYEKPVAMELNARVVSGQGPLSCFDGVDPGAQGGYDVCYTGTDAEAYFWPDCVFGPGALVQDPSYQVCVSGGQAQPWCNVGGNGGVMYDTCTAGPSDVP